MRKYAILTNNVVTNILDLEIEDLNGITQMFIDIQDTVPQPMVGWVLNGNKLEYPQGSSSIEQYEYNLAEKKTIFGIKLARVCINKMGARNKILNKNGTQVATLLNQLLPVKLLLETGALGTARYSCLSLKSIYTEYTDIFDHVINEINIFELANGL